MKERESKETGSNLPQSDELKRVAEIACKYFLRHTSQKAIAAELKISQTEVSRYTRLARECGVVRFAIDPSFTDGLEGRLKEKFPHLQKAIIVPLAGISPEDTNLLLEELGREGAQYFARIVPHKARIGVSCGVSVEAIIDALGTIPRTHLPVACHVHPLIILMRSEVVNITPAALVANLVKRLPEAKGTAFQLPPVPDYEFYRKNPEIARLLSDIATLDCYLIGLGLIDYEGRRKPIGMKEEAITHEFNSLIWKLNLVNPLKKYNAVAESLYQPFDACGTFLIDREELTSLRNCMLYLSLDILQKHVYAKTATIIAVAGGNLKKDAVYAGLHAQIFNVLITDSDTAEYVLEKEEAERNVERETKNLPQPDFESAKIVSIARQYFLHGKSQKALAEMFTIGQAEVSHYTRAARARGVVHITIDPFFTEDLEGRLKEKFPHLQKAIIVPLAGISPEDTNLLLKELGREGAQYFARIIPHKARIGVSCGVSVEAIIDALGTIPRTHLPVACHVHPLIILMRSEVVNITPAALVANLVKRLPEAKGTAFQLPPVPDGDEKAYELYRKNPEIARLLSDIATLDCYLTGLGFIDYEGRMQEVARMEPMITHEFNSLIWKLDLVNPLKKYNAVAESLYQPFDACGTFLIDREELTSLRNCMLYLSLDILQKHVHAKTATIIAVAGGNSKKDAVHAGLHAQIFNVLITDSDTAEYVLKKEEKVL